MVSLRWIVGCAVLGVVGGVAAAAPGDLDPSFGDAGVVEVNVRFDGYLGFAGAHAVAVLDDGSVLTAGQEDHWDSHFAVLRWRPDGVLDPDFGIGGRVLTNFADGIARAHALAALGDGTFLVAGVAEVEGVGHFALARYRADGSLDPTFGDGGRVLTPIGGGAAAAAMAVQLDGFVVVAGTVTIAGAPQFGLARYDADGAIDASFGDAGVLVHPVLGSDDEIHAVALQPDGKIVAAGSALNGMKRDFALARYLADGSLDASFGVGGTVTSAMTVSNDSIFAVAIQTDGRLVVAGDSYLFPFELADDVVVARYLSDGSLDESFGSTGMVALGVVGNLRAAAMQTDGKTLVAGTIYTAPATDFLLARLDADGSLDPTFGSDGIVAAPIDVDMPFGNPNLHDGAAALQVRPDGTIVTAGYAWNGIGSSFAAARHTAGGAFDASFGDGGIASAQIGSSYDDAVLLTVLPDGRLITGGSSYDGFWWRFSLMRHLPDGSVDESFGAHGRVITGPQFGWLGSAAAAVLPQPDGKLLAVGGANALVILRYEENGTIDPSFGVGGVATSSVGSAAAVRQQSDGKLVLAGSWQPPGATWPRFHVSRFHPDGSIDTSFGVGGAVDTAIGIAHSFATSLAIQPDGKLVVAGRASHTSFSFAIVRYLPNGDLDESFADDGIVFPVPDLFSSIANAVTLQADGKLLVAGESHGRMAVARFDSDGLLDPSFAGDGTLIVPPVAAMANYDEATDVLLQSDGKILLIGASSSDGPSQGVAVVRVLEDGLLDDSFASGGASFVPGEWWTTDGVLQSPQTLVVGGRSFESSYPDFFLARFDLGPIGGGCLSTARQCRSAAKSSMLLRDNDDDRRDKLVLKWSRAEPVAASELGDPTVDAAYSVCFYDDQLELLPAATIFVGPGQGWSVAGDRGFGYRDRDGIASGVQRMIALGSDRDAAKALVKGRGVALPDLEPALPLPITVQLVNERSGSCVGTTFTADDVIRNQPGLFQAKATRP